MWKWPKMVSYMKLIKFHSGAFSLITVFSFQIFTYNIYAINCMFQKFTKCRLLSHFTEKSHGDMKENLRLKPSIIGKAKVIDDIASVNQCDLFFVFFSFQGFLIFPPYLKS